MKQHTIPTAIAFVFLASAAVHAQQTVQWKVADGGNGHWYQQSNVGTSISWGYAKDAAERSGGHLACLEQSAENGWVWEHVIVVEPDGPSEFAGWIGLQQTGGPEPAGGWEWISGGPLTYFDTVNFDNAYGFGPESFGCYYQTTTYPAGNWADNNFNGCWVNDCVTRYVTEWSADCNADGLIDYGQCHNGTLPDYNGNNVPDCCERSEACVSGSYPVQWRAEDGGNGHWYLDDPQPPIRTFSARNEDAVALGAHLATVTSESEHKFVLRVAFPTGLLGPNDMWPALGGFRNAGRTQWAWVTGEPFVYAPFSPDPPNYEQSQWLMMWGIDRYTPLLWWTGNGNTTVGRAILEWSADCNNDGIVDYGQILQDQLADTNTDSIPDTCQCATIPSLPNCCIGDINGNRSIDGADIGLLLYDWGPCGSVCLADLNSDGNVNGGDIGLLLSGWGPCPN